MNALIPEPALHVAVVIPFFQREGGPLVRALRSIAGQRGFSGRLSVIVVDDGSPVTAESEISAADVADLAIIPHKQANAGPAAARNAGLNLVPDDCQYVAFLDSDDQWKEDHVARAVQSLEQGFDFYFANFLHLDQTIGAFERAGRLKLTEHRPLGVPQDVRSFDQDFYGQIIVGNVIGTSTVVIRWSVIRDLRFQEEFVYAGEDYLFWMDTALRTRKAAFSSEIECTYGRGVNLYSGSGWGTPRSLDRIVHETRFKRQLLAKYPLTPSQKQSVRESLARLRTAFAADVLHRIRNRSGIRLELLSRQLRVDPMSYVELPRHVFRALLHRT